MTINLREVVKNTKIGYGVRAILEGEVPSLGAQMRGPSGDEHDYAFGLVSHCWSATTYIVLCRSQQLSVNMQRHS